MPNSLKEYINKFILKEIGVNSPSITPEKVYELSKKISYTVLNDEENDISVDKIAMSYGYDPDDDYDEWLSVLDSIKLNKLYNDLVKTWNKLNPNLEEDEGSTSGDVGAYSTPKAFKGKEKCSCQHDKIYEIIKSELLKENSFKQFKQSISYRSKNEQLNRAIKQVKKRLQEIDSIVEYTSKMKQELSEGDGIKYWKETQQFVGQISEMMASLNEKMKSLQEDSNQEQAIVDDILGNLQESVDFKRVLTKIKEYSKKGLLTASIIAALILSPKLSKAEKDTLYKVPTIVDTIYSPLKNMGDQMRKEGWKILQTSPDFKDVYYVNEYGLFRQMIVNNEITGFVVLHAKPNGTYDVFVRDNTGKQGDVLVLQNAGIDQVHNWTLEVVQGRVKNISSYKDKSLATLKGK